MCDIYSGIGLDFYSVLVPGSSHVLIRHLTLKNGLILCLHCEVCNALVDLQFFLYTVRKTQAQSADNGNYRIRCNKMMMYEDNMEKKLDAAIVCEDNMVIIFSSVRCSLSLCGLCVLYRSNRHKGNS